jgi:broad specificity phosphatase PhoE
MTLFFMRHGETHLNSDGRQTGRLDVPLAPRGRDQASAMGRSLLAILAERRIDPAALPFHVSPLGRTRETAELVRIAMGLDPKAYSTDARLLELSLGAWEGLTNADIARRYPKELAARRADHWNVAPPGGETYGELEIRVLAALGDYVRPCAIVAHAGTGRGVLAAEGGVAPAVAADMPMRQGRVLVIENGSYAWS